VAQRAKKGRRQLHRIREHQKWNIENGNIDSNLTSKNWRLVCSKINDGKIKFIIKNGNIKKVVRNYINNRLSASMLGRH